MQSFFGREALGDLPRYAGLIAARAWHLVVASEIAPRPAVLDADERQLLSELWQRCRDQWDRDDRQPWFVRELMVALAAAFGNESLVPSLLDFVQPRYAEGKSSMARTAAHACTALAAITGVDLRFDDRGAPRPLADVAKDYRERLTRK
ncbi:MAG: hypothetical protein FJ265_08375 [Planctomycetes bacterium]|nr:hypothetical protein [Planctomycetota bacterium]